MPLARLFPEDRIPAMHAHLARFAEGFGIRDIRPQRWLANTERVLAMAEHARDEGKLPALRDAAMNAYWREGNRLESDEDLRAIARVAGLEPQRALAASDDPVYRERVEALSQKGREAGVTGIPTFFIGRYPVVGCQPYQTLAMVAERAGATRRTG